MKQTRQEPAAPRQIISGEEQYADTRRLSPLLKWAGGKEQELKYILPNLPPAFQDYYEPFVGGGAVYTAVDARHYYINDKSDELISLYRSIINADRPAFFATLDEMIRHWDQLTQLITQHAAWLADTYRQYSQGAVDDDRWRDLLYGFVSGHRAQFHSMFASVGTHDVDHFIREVRINLVRKSKRMKELEHLRHLLPESDILDNIETALKSAFYMHVRHLYNHAATYQLSPAVRSAIFLFIRNFAYSGMFRYNANGDFNVPYGGIGYNRKNLRKKIDYLRSPELEAHLSQTTIENLDFEAFFQRHPPQAGDFIFLDPPYDSEFSTYARNEFTREDQARLARYLTQQCPARWMMIIKNTDFIYGLYSGHGLRIRTFDKTYLVSFMNRNDKNVKHLLITNY